MLEYQKRKLLADCYACLKPTKSLLNKYIQSLDEARNADEIDEKKYLFLRTHKVVLDSLMNVTKGDYARFNSRTYLEVYDDIQAKSLKLYKDEAAAHEQTREKLKNLEEKSADERQKKEEEIEALKEHIATLEQNERTREEQQLNRKANTIGTIATIILAGIPYIALSVAIEFFKTRLSIETIWKWIIGIAGAIIATLIVGILFSKVQKWCFGKARFVLEKHR